MAVLPQLLQPALVNKRVSRLLVNNDALQEQFGFQKGGRSVQRIESRRGSYDVFNETRDLPAATIPGTERPTVARHPVGNVAFSVPRATEKLPIPLEMVSQFRPIGGPVNQIDQGGEQFIVDQEANQKQKLTNLREFQTAAMLRGSYYWTPSGEDSFYHSFSSGTHQINFQVPSTNKSQLDMIGAGDIIGVSWDNPAAPLVRDLLAISSAFIQLVGIRLSHVWCTSNVWGNVMTNIEVQNIAGAANKPYETLSTPTQKEVYEATIPGIPWVKWHIIDNGINTGAAGSFTKLIGDSACAFTTETNRTMGYYECPEAVVDPVTNSSSMQYGEYYYHKLIDDPAAYELHTLFNGIPVLEVPASIAYGTVIFS